MSKKDIIISFIKQFLDKPLPLYKRREVCFEFIKNENIRKAYTIIWPRRAGKSYFCFQIIDDLLKSWVSKNNILYFLLENDEFYPLETDDLNIILESYFELTGKINEKVYIFLDEIQEVPQFEKFVRKILDNYQNIELIITWSSSKLLSKEIDTSLRWRTLTYEILPLNYKEYLNWNGFSNENILSKNQSLELKNLEFNLFKYWNFPEIVVEENEINKNKYLRNYFDLIFYRDIVERNGIKSIKLIKTFRKVLLSSISNLISINSMSQNIWVENNTLTNWLNAFLDSYLFFEIKWFSFSTFSIEKSLSKIYTIDIWFYNIIFSDYKEDYGKIFENQVFLELRKKWFIENENIFYYKTKAWNEIDFLLIKDKKIIPIQVCWDLQNTKTFEREKKSLLELLDNFKDIEKWYIITKDKNIEILEKNIEILEFRNFGKLL